MYYVLNMYFMTLRCIFCSLFFAVSALRVSAEILLPDPSILFDGGIYYLIGTDTQVVPDKEDNQIFPLYKSKDLIDWSCRGSDGKFLYLADKKDLYGACRFWAPQMFKRGGKYYLAYCSSAREDKLEMYISIAEADSAEGKFKLMSRLAIEGMEIDPFVFADDDGSAYLYFVYWRGHGIHVRKLSPDLKSFDGKLRRCVYVNRDWERKPLPTEFDEINKELKSKPQKDSLLGDFYNASSATAEGPTVLKRGEKYVMFYSANDFRSPDYCVGCAVADSPMGEWKKLQDYPIISREKTGLNGSGHGDVFTDADGQLWYVFHAHHSNIRVSPRRTAIVRLVETFGEDGYPRYEMDYSSMRLL